MTDLVPDQAERIYKLLEAAFKMTIETAIEIGKALTEQKAAMKHGEFGPWIEANLPITKQMARKYMKVYAHRDEIQDAPDLTTAYQKLAKGNLSFLLPSPDTPPPPEVIDTAGEDVPGGTPDAVSEPEPPENEPSPAPKRHAATIDMSIPAHQPMVVMGPDPVPEAETLPAASGIEEEESALPETSGDPLADIRGGLGVAPLNDDAVPVRQMSAAEARAVRPGYTGPLPEPEEDGVVRIHTLAAPTPPEEPEPDERPSVPLPADWIITLAKVRESAAPTEKVTEALEALVKWACKKFPREADR